MKRTWGLVLCVLPQFLLVAGLAVREEFARATGQEILLEVRAYDPMDALAGRYVATPPAIERLELARIAHDEGLNDLDEVWVVLAPGATYWEPLAVRAAPPELADGQARLCARVDRGRWSEGDDVLTVDYGIGRFYIPDDGEDPSAWRAGGEPRPELALRVKVTSSGRATIEDLLVDGRPYAEWNR